MRNFLMVLQVADNVLIKKINLNCQDLSLGILIITAAKNFTLRLCSLFLIRSVM